MLDRGLPRRSIRPPQKAFVCVALRPPLFYSVGDTFPSLQPFCVLAAIGSERAWAWLVPTPGLAAAAWALSRRGRRAFPGVAALLAEVVVDKDCLGDARHGGGTISRVTGLVKGGGNCTAAGSASLTSSQPRCNRSGTPIAGGSLRYGVPPWSLWFVCILGMSGK